MEYFINDECINCGACEMECPMKAINKPVQNILGEKLFSKVVSTIHYFINPLQCDKCIIFSSPMCIEVCPMDSIKSY